MYLHVHNYIGYSFSITSFMLSTSLNHEVFKGHQIPITRVTLHYSKKRFRTNMILPSFSNRHRCTYYLGKHYAQKTR